MINAIIASVLVAGVVVGWVRSSIHLVRKIEHHRKNLIPDSSRPIDHLTIIREVETTNYLRKYIVILDGKKVGYIASGETRHFSVESGKHTLQVRVDWCTSKPWIFEMVSDSNVDCRCGATYKDWRCAFMFAVSPSTYLYVRDE